MAGGTSFGVAVERVRERAYCVAARGEIDVATADELASAVRRLWPADEVVVDLSRVSFIDAAGVRALLRLRRHAEQQGIGFRIARPSAPVRRVLEVTSLSRGELGLSW